MKNFFLLFLLILISCAQKPKNLRETPPECLEKRASFDIGSGETRMRVAFVDICRNILLSTELEKREKVSYKEDLGNSGKFSEQIMNQGLDVLRKMKMEADKINATDYQAVATQAFRDAKNAQAFINRINTELKINARIITQKEEALLGYYGALAISGGIENKIAVWDIGGSSQQIIFKDEKNNFIFYEGQLASVNFKDRVIKEIQRKKGNSPNPLNKKQIESAKKLAGNAAISTIPARVKNRLSEKDIQTIGIGGVFFYSLLQKIHPDSEDNNLTLEEINIYIEKLEGKTDSDFKNEKHSETNVTNAILVYGFMKALNVSNVDVFNVNLTQGLLIHPELWKKLAK